MFAGELQGRLTRGGDCGETLLRAQIEVINGQGSVDAELQREEARTDGAIESYPKYFYSSAKRMNQTRSTVRPVLHEGNMILEGRSI